MIADALRVEIEMQAVRVRRENPIFVGARQGTVTPAIVATYLASMKPLLTETLVSIAYARDVARQRGDTGLGEFLAQKVVEEDGHAEWAARDLRRVAPKVDVAAVGATRGLVELQRAVIDEDPTLFLAYMLFAEYLTVLVGGQWLDLLEKNCGIPRSSMTVVGNHVELDKDHVQENLDNIDRLVGDPRKLPRLREVLRDCVHAFDAFCADVVNTGRRDERISREVVQHVSPA